MKNPFSQSLGLFASSAFLAAVTAVSVHAADAPKKILVVGVTTEFRHSSIETAEKILAKLGKDSGAFTVDYARQPANEPSLNRPSEPKKPSEPKNDGDETKFKKAMEKYHSDLEKFPAAVEKYKTDSEKFPDLEAKYKPARAAWEARRDQALEKLSLDSLKNYDAVVFANTTGNLPLPDKQGFIDWVKAGHAFIGTHSASDTFHGFRPYIEMLGGEFETHHAQVAIDAINQDREHPACRHLDPAWHIFDEIYIIKSFNRASVHGLLTLNHHPNDKTKAGDYPVAWCKEFGQGRVFYTSLGHREDVWENPIYQVHLLGGIKWALGLAPGDGTPQAK